MSNRTARQTIALKTVEICRIGQYRVKRKEVDIRENIEYAINHTYFVDAREFCRMEEELKACVSSSEDLDDESDESVVETSNRETRENSQKTRKTKIEICKETVLLGAQALSKGLTVGNSDTDERNFVFVLNFASAKNPGGGFLNGSQAQEESLARSSALYPCIEGNKMYATNKKSNNKLLYRQAGIYTPRCPVFRRDSGALLPQFYSVGFCTLPAPNAGCLRRGVSVETLNETMRARIRGVLLLARKHGHRRLVLGAYGCGVFRNDVRDVARLFYQELHGDFASSFDVVRFSITPDSVEKFRRAWQSQVDAALTD